MSSILASLVGLDGTNILRRMDDVKPSLTYSRDTDQLRLYDELGTGMSLRLVPVAERMGTLGNGMQVLVGNEPRAYREVLAAAIGVLRPHVQVAAIPAIDLDREVLALQPSVVICSDLSRVIESVAASWIMLYPDGEGESIVSIHGLRSTPADMGLDAVLQVIDETEIYSGDYLAAFG